MVQADAVAGNRGIALCGEPRGLGYLFRVLRQLLSQKPQQLFVTHLIFQNVGLGQQPFIVRDIFTVHEALH